MKKILFLVLVSISSVYSQKNASITLNFENFVGDEQVVLKEKNYKNAAGEEFNISLLQYYVSNIKLTRKDGSEYVVPQEESYFLIRESRPETKKVVLNNIPKGNYTGVSFVIGVDSAKSASDVSQRKGCLDVGGDAEDMYWVWNSGYIFVKMEGKSPQSSSKNNAFMYHIGLFGGIGDKKTLNNIRVANVIFEGKTLKVKAENTAITIKTDVSKILGGETTVSMAKNPVVMGGPFSEKIANNYKTMFSFGGFRKPDSDISSKSSGAVGLNK